MMVKKSIETASQQIVFVVKQWILKPIQIYGIWRIGVTLLIGLLTD